MHALITADTVGGVWTYVQELVTGLVRRGVRVTLVSFGEIPDVQQTGWMEGLAGLDFRPTAFHLEWMQDAPSDLELSSEYLASVIREVGPDVVHLNQYAYGALAVDVPKMVVAHSDVVSWWIAVHGQEPRASEWICWYRDMVRQGLAGAKAVVAPSQWMLDTLQGCYGPIESGRVIHNGRTPTLFHPYLTKENTVISVGRLWDGGKQVSLLTQVESPIPIYLVGAERHPDSGGYVESRRAKSRVQFKGQLTQPELRQLYARAGIYVATSRYEPFGLAPLEAALSRCAIIANDIPTFHELWGENAYYFRCNDVANLESAISRMVSERELRIQYGNLAYHHARQQFNAARMVDQYLALYESLVGTEVRIA